MTLGGAGQVHDRLARGVVEHVVVGQELIDVADEAQDLAGGGLALLGDEADVVAVLVPDGELVGDLDELGLLVHDHAVVVEEL